MQEPTEQQWRITLLEASLPSKHSLSIRVRLADESGEFVFLEHTAEPQLGGERPCLRSMGLLNLLFSLTTPDGRKVAGMEVTVEPGTRELSFEMPLLQDLPSDCSLTAALCAEEEIIAAATLLLHG